MFLFRDVLGNSHTSHLLEANYYILPIHELLGLVIENLINASPSGTRASFYRTAAGAEIDLLLEFGGRRGTWAIEIKKSLAPKTDKGFHIALDDLKPERTFVVHAGMERYPKAPGIEAIGLRELARDVAAGA